MTPFALLLQISGLSQREAASFLNISLPMIDKMSRGQRTASAGVITEMRDLIEQQDEKAMEALALIEQSGAEDVEIGYPIDDHEARSLGWPSVGAWRAMAARVIASTDAEAKLVPRGSTVATAGAADAHEAVTSPPPPRCQK